VLEALEMGEITVDVSERLLKKKESNKP